MAPKIEMEAVLIADGQEIKFAKVKWGDGKISQGDYVLQTKAEDLLHFKFARKDGQEMDAEKVIFRISQELKNFSQLIVPDCGRSYMLHRYPLNTWFYQRQYDVTGPNDGNPFVAFVSQSGECSLAAGIVGEPIETTFWMEHPGMGSQRASLAAHGGRMIFSFERPGLGVKYGPTREISEALYVGEGKPNWHTALREYSQFARSHLGITEYPRNPKALEPVWCSWSAFCSDDINDELVLGIAEAAKELGIGSILLDDGWFGTGIDTSKDKLNTGDYFPDKDKFPNLKALVEKIHEMGLMAILWVGPISVSPDSEIFKQVKDFLIQVNNKLFTYTNDLHQLCPASPEARRHIVDIFSRLLKDYGVDGFKVDLYNNLPPEPCDAPHQHDEKPNIQGLHRLMREIWETIHAIKPDVIMELKQNYGNFLSAQYGTMVRAGDSPYDTDINLARCIYTSACVGLVHNDYLVWTSLEKESDLSTLLIKQLICGVPTFSVDLREITGVQKKILQGWVRNYHSFFKNLLFTTTLVPQGPELNVWQRDDGRRSFIGLIYGAREAELLPREETLLMNGTACDYIYLKAPSAFQAAVQTFSPSHKRIAEENMSVKEGLKLSIPSGGYCLIRST